MIFRIIYAMHLFTYIKSTYFKKAIHMLGRASVEIVVTNIYENIGSSVVHAEVKRTRWLENIYH